MVSANTRFGVGYGLQDGAGETAVVPRRASRVEVRLPEPVRQHLGGGGAVRLGEDDVERDDAGATLEQPPEQLRDQGSRPGPLPEAPERFLVDFDDGDRCG